MKASPDLTKMDMQLNCTCCNALLCCCRSCAKPTSQCLSLLKPTSPAGPVTPWLMAHTPTTLSATPATSQVHKGWRLGLGCISWQCWWQGVPATTVVSHTWHCPGTVLPANNSSINSMLLPLPADLCVCNPDPMPCQAVSCTHMSQAVACHTVTKAGLHCLRSLTPECSFTNCRACQNSQSTTLPSKQ